MRIPELLAPAGTMEKAKTAIAYGADALYLAGKQFGMRASAGNFDVNELEEILDFAHTRGVRIYVTVNTFPHNNEIALLPDYLKTLRALDVDAIILADVGVLRLAKEYAPQIPLHLSTQANTVNWQACQFWKEQGIERIVLARELNREDIALIRQMVDVELEMFVHGAMCMAYSGRCLLSKVMTGRDANRGACAQSCRWKYHVVEESRPGEYYPIGEERDGTYIFNSKDLSLLEHLPDIVRLGVDSLKIEGRMKSAYFVATVVRAYRAVLDGDAPDMWLDELDKVSHRPYYSGFYIPTNDAGTYLQSSAYSQDYDFVGIVDSYDNQEGVAIVDVRNRLAVGDVVEIMQPKGPNLIVTIEGLIRHNRQRELLDEAHANYTVRIRLPEVRPFSMLRINRSGSNEAR